MGHNRAGDNRKKKIKRYRKELEKKNKKLVNVLFDIIPYQRFAYQVVLLIF